MKLIFDLTKTQPLGDSKFHGGGKYGEIIFKALIAKSNDIVAFYDSTKWFNPDIAAICRELDVTLIDANECTLKEAADNFGGVIYSPLIENDIRSIGENTYICTIHGLRTLEMPFDNYKGKYKYNSLSTLYSLYGYLKSRIIYHQELTRYRKVCLMKNVHVVTVSEHSKASLLSFVPLINNANIKVYYSPSTSKSSDHISLINKNHNKKYYLLVSANRWIKNSLRAIKAFDELFSDFPSLEGDVILTGVMDANVFKKDLTNPSRFKFFKYIEEEELQSLYQGAFLFVYPSLNEGFGYPPLEAMAQGTPVIASAISSIPEVCGDAVLYFNPFLISEIKMRILQMENNDVREQYIKKGTSRFEFIEERQQNDLHLFVEYLLSFLKNNIHGKN